MTSRKRQNPDEEEEGGDEDGDGSVTYDLFVTPSTSKKQNIKRRRRKSKGNDEEDELRLTKMPKEGVVNSESSPVLRRSKRLSHPELIEDLGMFATPPPTDKKKPRGRPRKSLDIDLKSVTKRKSRKCLNTVLNPSPTIFDIPTLAMERILNLLDVKGIEALGQTCSYFDQMICGNFITSLNFPFDESFIEAINSTKSMDKKPLLRLVCNKSKARINDLNTDASNKSKALNAVKNASIQKILSSACPETIEYLVYSQFSLLSLNQLRELDLRPEDLSSRLLNYESNKTLDNYKQLDMTILQNLQLSGSLKNLTKLDIVLDNSFYADECLDHLPDLRELGIVMCGKTGMNKYQVTADYISRLESIVKKVKVSTLKLEIVSETKKSVVKVLENSFIQKLIVTGPCTFNAIPVMENLKEIEVQANPPAENNEDCCSYFKTKADDRKSHRTGLCVINIGAAYEHCPKLERFMGHNLAELPLRAKDKSQSQLTFKIWNTRMKKHFHEDYAKSGGTLDFKAWSKTRWISKKPNLPIRVGRGRVSDALYDCLFKLNPS